MQRRIGRSEEFAGADTAQFISAGGNGVRAGKFSGAEVSGREIEIGKAGGVASGVNGGEIVVLTGIEGRIDRGAGGEDARDIAADDLFGELWVFELIADGDAEPLAEKARDVTFGGVPGNTAHGDGTFPVACGQRDLKLTGGGLCVVEKKFIKVAHAEEEQGVRMLTFCGPILAHEGRLSGGGLRWGNVRHGYASIP